MDNAQRTAIHWIKGPGPLSEQAREAMRPDVTRTEKLVELERRLMRVADRLPPTYSRILKETADSVDQMTTMLNPLHQTRAHPRVMLWATVGVGYITGRFQSRRPASVPL